MEKFNNISAKIVGTILFGFGIYFFLLVDDLNNKVITLIMGALLLFFGFIIFTRVQIKTISMGLFKLLKIDATAIEKADKKLVDEIRIAEKIINQLQVSNKFKATAIRAQYDYDALEQMNELSEDKSFPSSSEAKIVYDSTLERYDYTGYPPIDYSSTPPIFKNKKVTIDDIQNAFDSANKFEKRQIIGHLWSNSNFCMKDRMSFFIENIQKEKNNLIVAYLGKFFIKATENVAQPLINCKPLEINKILSWWNKNKNTVSI